MAKRLFDIVLSFGLLVVFCIPIVLCWLFIKLTSEGSPLYWSKRSGKYNTTFLMPKFRTMLVDTPQLATHLLSDSKSYLTPFGNLLRKSSLDELPQLWSILKGDMSFVGPRPALFNQYDLIGMRKKLNIDGLTPGLTGWAQINGRDSISLEQKVELDLHYLTRKSFWFDIKILLCLKYELRDKMPNKLINPGIYEIFVMLIISKYPLKIIKGIDLKSRSKEN